MYLSGRKRHKIYQLFPDATPPKRGGLPWGLIAITCIGASVTGFATLRLDHFTLGRWATAAAAMPVADEDVAAMGLLSQIAYYDAKAAAPSRQSELCRTDADETMAISLRIHGAKIRSPTSMRPKSDRRVAPVRPTCKIELPIG